MGDLFKKVKAFEWDSGNIDKNWKKHRVANKESEEAFLDKFLLTGRDIKHSTLEVRHLLYGQSKKGKYLAISFTFRFNFIRIISARQMNKKEIINYEKQKNNK